jgi:hypothetical protein
VKNGFTAIGEEILFFKTVGPSVVAWQFYAADRFAIELVRTVDLEEKVVGYLRAGWIW